jgi:hypothetical protein
MDQREFLAGAAVAGTGSWVQQRPRRRQKPFTAVAAPSERSFQQRLSVNGENFRWPTAFSISTIISTSTALLEVYSCVLGAPKKIPALSSPPFATRNACQPGTSLRLAVCLGWPGRARKPRNIGLIRSLAVVHRVTLVNSRTRKGPPINDKTGSGAGHVNH